MKELNIKSRLHNEADVLEVDDKSLSEAVIPFIEADKEIISKINIYYEGGVTYFLFPIGILPLSITLNTHTLYLLNDKFVDAQGHVLQDYEIDEVYVEETTTGNCFVGIGIIGDITEQVINGLTYINFDKVPIRFTDTYHLFFPITSTGTKLYKHNLVVNTTSGTYSLTFITTSNSRFSVTGGPPKPTIPDGYIIQCFSDTLPFVLMNIGNDGRSVYTVRSLNDSTVTVNLVSCTITSETVEVL